MRRAAVLLLLLSTAAGCGGDDAAPPERSYPIGLEIDDSGDRYRYVATDAVDIRVGDEVTFELDNTGTLIHDVRVVAPDGVTVAQSELAAPGATVAITVRFEEAGFFRLECLVDDHLTAYDMQTFVEVTDSAG